jgi:hypothetical protein
VSEAASKAWLAIGGNGELLLSREQNQFDLSARESIHGTGTLRKRTFAMPVASFNLTRQRFRPADEWELTAHVSREHWPQWNFITNVTADRLELEGITDSGEGVRLPNVQWVRQTAGRLQAEVSEVQFNIESSERVPNEQFITIRLSPTPLALPVVDGLTRSWTGELSVPPQLRVERGAAIIPTELGLAELYEHHLWDDVQVEGMKGRLSVAVPSLHIKVAAEARSADPLGVMKRCAVSISDALLILSLLSRRFVRWTEIELHSRWYDEGRLIEAKICRWLRSISLADINRFRTPLVNPHCLPTDAIGQLTERFRELPFKDAVSAAITYSVATREAFELETSFATAFTALEALTSGVARDSHKDRSLTDKTFRALSTRLKKEIARFIAEEELSEEVKESIVRKLPELQRQPIIAQIVAMLSQYGVHWSDLWPNETEVSSGLRQAFSRRNAFFHGGKFPAAGQAFVDAQRLCVLTERALYSILDGSSDWLDIHAYRDTPSLSRIEAEALHS